MPTKSKPRWKWERGIFRISNPFSEGDIQYIENILNFGLTEDQKQSIIDAAINLISNLHFFDNRPKISEKRSAFELVSRKASELAQYLDILDSDSIQNIEENIGASEYSIEDLKNYLYQLHFAAQISLKELPSKGGHPEEIARKLFILELLETFNNESGITSGVFNILIFSILEILAKKGICDPPQSKEAVDKAIRLARKKI